METISYFDQSVKTFIENGRLMQLGLSQVGWKLRFKSFEENCRDVNELLDEDLQLDEGQLWRAINDAWELIQ